MTPQRQTLDFFSRWSLSFDDMCHSFEDTFGERCRWDQRPMALTVGIDPAIKLLERSRKLMGLYTIDVDVIKIVAKGEIVFTERVDHLRRKNGELIVSAPVAGVLTFKDDKLVEWREYFDVASMMTAAGVNGVTGLAREVWSRAKQRAATKSA